ncbi:MAG: CotH kinase family protein [Flavobacteriales bacterium]
MLQMKICSSLLFLIISFYSYSQNWNDVTFSHHAGFYEKPFYLKITAIEGDVYFFNENNINNNRKLFPDSLLIDKTTALSLLYQDNDTIVKLGSYSYFVQFETKFKVVSISIDNDFLFDEYKGIYHKGPRAYFDTIAKYYKNTNWVKKWERENYVEIFNEAGERIIGQASGIKIFGGMTKHYPEKSLRLIARPKYEENRFNADIFDNGKKKYKQFVLRHSGNDYRQLRFKDAFITSLAAESDLDVQASSPAHLFVNSEYWGVYNIREKINEFYIDNNHNSGVSSVDILQGYRTLDVGTKEAYNKLLSFVKDNDLSVLENYQEVQTMMDTRNFANFWIHQIYSVNHDARGNIRFWRSDSLDGKFRWIVYDTDLAFGYNRHSHNVLKDFTSKIMTEWYNPRWATFLLRNLLTNESFKNDFINQSSYILSSTLSTQNINDKINAFQNQYEDEMKTHFSMRKKFQRYQGDMKSWNKSIQKICEFADKRDEFSFIHLEDKFNLNKPYFLQININNFDKGQVSLNDNFLKNDKFNGSFYSEFELPIAIHSNIGFSSEGYLYDTITALSGDTVIINISFTPNNKSDSKVIMNEVDYVNDCFEIFNQGDETINLNGWKITDRNSNVHTITNGVLKKGGFVVFHNKLIENKIDSVDYFKIDFKISSTSELLTLYDNKGCMVDSISYNLTGIENSYSRNIPFDNIEETTVIWENNSDFTIGYHNESYTSLINDKIQVEIEEKKQSRTLYITLGLGLVVLTCLFILIFKKR